MTVFDHFWPICVIKTQYSTIKNRFYGNSTSFTQDPEELKKKNLSYGQNKRSSEHFKLYGDKPFDKEIHIKY